MATYSSIVVANTMLHRSFRDKKLITCNHLQHLLYEADTLMSQRHGEHLFLEKFRYSTSQHRVPELANVAYMFDQPQPITRYASNGVGQKKKMLETAQVTAVLETVWAAHRNCEDGWCIAAL